MSVSAVYEYVCAFSTKFIFNGVVLGAVVCLLDLRMPSTPTSIMTSSSGQGVVVREGLVHTP